MIFYFIQFYCICRKRYVNKYIKFIEFLDSSELVIVCMARFLFITLSPNEVLLRKSKLYLGAGAGAGAWNQFILKPALVSYSL